MKYFTAPTVLILTSLLVVLIFSTIEDRITAGFIAGNLFLASTVFNLSLYGRTHVFKRAGGYLHLGFLLFFVFPILVSRILDWNASFADMKILFFTGAQLHQYSSSYYKIMLLIVIFEQGFHFWTRKKRLKAA